jgi:cyclin D1/2/4
MSHPHSPDHCASAVNSLYCGEDASEVVRQDADTWISSYHQSPSPSTIPSPPSDENTITKLIDSESQFMPLSDYLHRCRHRSIDTTARQDSINWILKVPIRMDTYKLTLFVGVVYPFECIDVVVIFIAWKCRCMPTMPSGH